MSLKRITLLLWLVSLALVGLACVADYFGDEYGVVYFFTVFPAVLFIQAIKDETNRRRIMELFTWVVGALCGYCILDALDEKIRVGTSFVLALVLTGVAHLLFGRFVKKISRQSTKI